MNRRSHYKKRKDVRERDLDFLLNKEVLKKISFIAHFENQSPSRIVEAAIRYYFLKKKGACNAFKRSKKNYKKTFPLSISKEYK